MADEIVNFRVDGDLKRAFAMAAEKEDLTSSQMLRAFMREKVAEYMKNKAQGTLLKPSNEKIKAKGKGQFKDDSSHKSVIPESWRVK